MFNFPKIALLSLLIIPFSSFGAEFVIMNQNVTLTSASCGFYFVNDPSNGPVSWYSPDNYVNGQVYFRFEVVSQPTNTTSYFSFDIWGDHSGSYYTESASSISGPLNGTGTSTTFNSSPATWWPNSNGSVNFSNRSTFWRWGICHWFSKSPNYLLAPLHWSDDPESWDAWAHNGDWLPITVNVIIVAVSQGSAFSGWENYLTPVTKHPTPTYGIDYAAATTNKAVASTDQCSYSADMSNPVNGNGQKLALTPGQNVYFQTPASGGLTASDIQALTVPARPAAPSYNLDYVNETTNQNIPNTVEYSTSSGFSGAAAGAGIKVAITPGQDLYFRVKSTGSSFASTAFMLDVPSRQSTPSIAIDYANEVTSAIAGAMEYSANSSMTPATNGSNASVAVTPGTDLYIRTKATSSLFKSDIQTLDVPVRPVTPAISVNFGSETTSSVPSTMEFSANAAFTGASLGTNSGIAVTPGVDLYFRTRATSSQFKSDIQTLDIPGRPATPAITFDFITELTSPVTSAIEYANSVSMSPSVTGTNAAMQVTPGANMYFRVKATDSQFHSDIQTLAIPVRPATPAITIDYVNEITSTIPATMEYATDVAMSTVMSGAGQAIPLIPGTNMYFRVAATSSQLKSEVQSLIVPQRPATTAFAIDFDQEKTSSIVSEVIEYSLNADMTDALTGPNDRIKLIPGTTTWFRQKVTESQFASLIQELFCPFRPLAPAFTINYDGETTVENVSSLHEYSMSEDMSELQSGTDTALALIPGNEYYIRLKHTGSSFDGDTFHLYVPPRPEIISSIGDTVTSTSFTATVQFNRIAAGFDASDVEAINADVTLTNTLTLHVVPASTGPLTLKIKANAIDGGNFESQEFVTYYKKVISGIEYAFTGTVLIYPSPVSSFLKIEASEKVLFPIDLSLVDGNGAIIYAATMDSGEKTIDMIQCTPGLYILKLVDLKGNSIVHKVIKK
jgi:hypothetical protein